MIRKPPSVPPVREWRTIPPIVNLEIMMAIIDCGRSNFDQLLAAGMPCLNIGHGRERRTLRFEPQRVIEWLRQRNGDSL